MPERATIRIRVNGRETQVAQGATLAAALLNAGVAQFRRSTTGQLRSPLCAMGICYECSVTVNGAKHIKSCQLICADGMEVSTDE
jgi:D-hydroxyproline dehydrogenase subunit gamma